ncbi:leucyl/phenylalanyl-tRNA--protein transferase [Chitinophaga pendula]|uniref:leucyl/phenylalanyl-tRNA--protein transferase n=1 Tax=Chitinophaga TaxID=79328 RepID=UPI000BB0398E|nr:MULTISPECIES: leucyl/phenylalanyl-tRNA--protein transferase [Chitinophaga]ASZ14393.1 leucyl/phenylalanyl-tRNA--protein transferase [Chitinophaga sp. MD30]UCJ07955.1 leucyl/phenylalanyl-tRNA--protein transferase [Chitinophaga pendula]
MPVFHLDKKLVFPPTQLAEPDGLLAAGGDLSTQRLLLAYSSGIFPWYSEPPILWWSPHERFVLFPEELKVSASMKQVLKKETFHITINQDFKGVISNCRKIFREGQDGTWITREMQQAYIRLHQAGHALSVECWQKEQLVGGLYGVKLGNCFFGESMFAHVSNASKAAFITFVRQAASQGLALIDCQVHTPHLESLGARFIPRDAFLQLIRQHTQGTTSQDFS